MDESLQFFKEIGSWLPATVVTAIILFLIKEILELCRKRAERARKKSAIKILLAEELEKNHWTFVSMFRILDSLKEAFEIYPHAVFWLHIARNGSEHFRMKEEPEVEYDSGQPIPKYFTEMYEKLLPSLAELDQSLFEVVRSTYENIVELGHYRETLTDFLDGEALTSEPDLTKQFLSDFVNEKDDYYAELNNGYKVLTGKELKSWKLR